MLDIREILRRVHLGEGDRRIARDLHVSRKTVGKYREWATAEGLLTGPLPEPGVLEARLAAHFPLAPPPRMVSKVARYRDQVKTLREAGVECRAIFDILREQHQFAGSYASVYRFVRALEPRTPEGFCRVETPPGDEAQVDFGYAGRLCDHRDGPKRRT